MAQKMGQIIIPAANTDPITVTLSYTPSAVLLRACTQATGIIRSTGMVTPPDVNSFQHEKNGIQYGGELDLGWNVQENAGGGCYGTATISPGSFTLVPSDNSLSEPAIIYWLALD